MPLDFQYLFNLGIMALAGVATYLFNKIQEYEKRIQKVEDVTLFKIDALIDKVDKLEISNEKLNTKFAELAYNIHREKNVESQLTITLGLLLKKLTENDVD